MVAAGIAIPDGTPLALRQFLPAHIRPPSWATRANFSAVAPSQRPADALPFLLALRGNAAALVMHPVCRFTCEGTGFS
jgi:hypothetical protein